MNCTRCEGEGLLNLHQFDEDLCAELGLRIDEADADKILAALDAHPDVETDIAICDCCGDGEGWYGEPGKHYGPNDPQGQRGPYAYNGGLCECH